MSPANFPEPTVSQPELDAGLGFVDLFCGSGGFSWGFVRAGFAPLLAIDVDTPSIRTHELNFSRYGCVSINRDLNKIKPEELVRLLGSKRRHLKVLVGGPPCQGWSKVGRGKIRSLPNRPRNMLLDPRNHLYERFLLMTKALRPPCVVMENVPGMLTVEGRNIADEIIEHFRQIRYRCSYVLANAWWFGVPQQRERLIFVAVRDNLGVEIRAEQLERWADKFRQSLRLPSEVTVGDAIGDLPRIGRGALEDPLIYPGRCVFSPYLRLMREGCDGLVTDHICRSNKQDVKAFTVMRQGMWYRDLPAELKRYRDDVFEDKYKRLYLRRRAWTVTAHLEKDCYTHIHPTQPRTLSIREAARLQSFPDSFRFFGNMGDRFRQVGNAVPPLMAWGIAEFIKAGLRGMSRS